MSTQAEIDMQARLADMERQIAELAAKVNPLYSGGMDRYIHSGYLQFDGIPIRWDTKGQQVESNGISRASVYFVNKLVPSPSGETERVELVGSVDSTSTLTSLNAIHSGGLGGVLLGAASGTANAELTIFVSGWSNQPRAKLYPLTTDIGKLELQDAVLSFAGLASDPGTLTDGLLWYNTTTDKLYARINGATVELGAGGGSMPMPPIISSLGWHGLGKELATITANNSVSSGTWPTANKAIFIPITVTEDITVVKLWCFNGATAAGNTNMALYTSAFVQVANSEMGSTAQTGTNVIQEFNITDVALSAGLYYIALVKDDTTGTVFRRQAPVGTTEYLSGIGMFEEASAFDLPATATPVVVSSDFIPLCGISTRVLVT